MADTRADIVIAPAIWTDLYAASSIAVGTAVTVFNKGSASLNLAIKATAPASASAGYPVGVFPNELSFASVPSGQTGLWAYSVNGTTVLCQD